MPQANQISIDDLLARESIPKESAKSSDYSSIPLDHVLAKEMSSVPQGEAPKYNIAQSALRGFMSLGGLTANAVGALGGIADTTKDAISGDKPFTLDNLKKNFDENKDAVETRNSDAYKQNPLAYTIASPLGIVAASSLLPGAAVANAGRAIGMVADAVTSPLLTATKFLPNLAIPGGAIGHLIGGETGTVGGALLGGAIKTQPIVEGALNVAKATGQALSAMGH